MNYIKMLLLSTLIITSVIMDLRSYKVKNELCASFIILGIICNTFLTRPSNLSLYFAGLVVPFIILLPLYALNMLGAGDIKLFCAIGAFVGIGSILQCIAYSFLSGLVVALIVMMIRRNFIERFNKLYDYFIYCILNMTIAPYEKTNSTSEGRIHFTIPIALGTIASYLL